MATKNNLRPAFQSLELDPIDARLEAKAAKKGIPTLVMPKAEPLIAEEPAMPVESLVQVPRKASRAAVPAQSTPRSRMKSVKIELPDYAWLALKRRTLDDLVSLRYFVLMALRAQGIHINDVDMIEDGRRLR
jgi:hypothetical protein